MLITKETEYAIIGLIHLAEHKKEIPIKILDIAKKENLSEEFLRKVFKKLRKAGLITPSFGPNGGISLAKNKKNISLLDIFNLTQGTTLIPCKNGKNTCKRKNCILVNIFKKAENLLHSFFSSQNISYFLTKS